MPARKQTSLTRGQTSLKTGQTSLRFGQTSASSLWKGGVVGPYPAPSGYRWDYVTENNIRVTEAGTPVVALRAA
jgi:hypothetical protein